MTKKTKNGFVLLYAVLVASVISITGVLLSDIIFKQLVLSSIGKESQFAYYAATAGHECARFWDNQSAFGEVILTPESGYTYDGRTIINQINCNGNFINVTYTTDNNNNKHIFTFTLLNLQNNSCSIVKVTKDTTQKPTTLFESRGYNQGGENCDSDHPRKVEKIIYRSF